MNIFIFLLSVLFGYLFGKMVALNKIRYEVENFVIKDQHLLVDPELRNKIELMEKYLGIKIYIDKTEEYRKVKKMKTVLLEKVKK